MPKVLRGKIMFEQSYAQFSTRLRRAFGGPILVESKIVDNSRVALETHATSAKIGGEIKKHPKVR